MDIKDFKIMIIGRLIGFVIGLVISIFILFH